MLKITLANPAPLLAGPARGWSRQLTKSSERLTRSAGMVLATGGALSWLMDVEDAKATLKFVAAKERTRAAKRKAAADAVGRGNAPV